eukprot:s7322_g2.t1
MDGDGGEEGEDLKEEEGRAALLGRGRCSLCLEPPAEKRPWKRNGTMRSLRLSEDEDTLRDSLEHAAKNAATGWWNLKGLQNAVASLLARKPTWEQALHWILDEARRFPTPLGSFLRREEETEAAPQGAEPIREPDLLPIYTEGALTVEMPETCPQLVLVGALHALNFHYCCGWISRVCWPPPPGKRRQLAALGGAMPWEDRLRPSVSSPAARVTMRETWEINADLVIGAWPQEGEAAVAEVTDFLEGDARVRPAEVLQEGARARHPGGVEQSRVGCLPTKHMMAPVDEGAIPRDSQGHLITNGAGAVEKRKMVNGKEVVMQRFISNFIPINGGSPG